MGTYVYVCKSVFVEAKIKGNWLWLILYENDCLESRPSKLNGRVIPLPFLNTAPILLRTCFLKKQKLGVDQNPLKAPMNHLKPQVLNPKPKVGIH